MSGGGPGSATVGALSALDWRLSAFDALPPHDLRRIFALRQLVFIVEQQCSFLDADARDEQALHLAAWRAGEVLPLACARLLPPGVAAEEPSIGRVATAEAVRGMGLGHETMQRAIAAVETSWPGHGVHISAQSRLERFYKGLGFVATGARYDEDGIPHTPMRRPAGA